MIFRFIFAVIYIKYLLIRHTLRTTILYTILAEMNSGEEFFRKKMLAKKTAICYYISSGRLTQLVECHLDMVEVAGSSPVPPIEGAKCFGTLLFLLFTQLSNSLFWLYPARRAGAWTHSRNLLRKSHSVPAHATSLKKTVLSNMGKLSIKITKRYLLAGGNSI